MKRTEMKNIFPAAVALGIAGIIGFGLMQDKSVLAQGESGQAENAVSYENGWEAADADKEYVYCVGSVSKIYSTAAVMKLSDEGKVRLDDPVTVYIPEFKMEDPRYKDITVRMLMDHTSGLMGSFRPGMLLYDDVDSYHLDHILESLSEQRLKADPGTYAAYCNDGFDLLGIITERVSGKSFTEYVKEDLAKATGGTATGTGYSYAGFEDPAPAYTPKYNRYDYGAAMSLGAGGVYATASDTAKFGATFFKGNDALLSEEAKDAMAMIWNDADDYLDGNGLGWDSVGEEKYDAAGIQVVGKGGDDGLNHAYLLVAPEEGISISVLSNGGSSALNGLVSQAILDACLEERGITAAEPGAEQPEIVTEIPASYDDYAGNYLAAGERGETVDVVSFPEHRYMHVESVGPYKTVCTDYALTEDGSFASLAYEVEDSGIDDMKLSVNPQMIRFKTAEDGSILIAAETDNIYPGIGSYVQKSYVGEKMEDAPVDEEVLAKWQMLADAEYCLSNDLWSSSSYDTAICDTVLPERFPGYVFIVNGMGTRLLKIENESRAVAFQTIPSSSSRDLIDVTILTGGGLTIRTSDDCEYISDVNLPEFDLQTKEVALKTGCGVWYRIGSAAAGTEPVITDRPENSAVCVYNKFGEVVYSTHVEDMTDVLPMPEDGKVLFLGEDGGRITLK